MDNFLVGVLSSIVAGLLVAIFRAARNGWSLRRMRGVWLQVIDERPRRYSLGTLYFDLWKAKYRYDGTAYEHDGSKRAYWNTVGAFFDKDHSQFLYIYEGSDAGSGATKGHGFGLIRVPTATQGYAQTDGYFIGAETAAPEQRNARFYRAKEVAIKEKILFDPRDDDSRKNLIEKLAAQNWPDRPVVVPPSVPPRS